MLRYVHRPPDPDHDGERDEDRCADRDEGRDRDGQRPEHRPEEALKNPAEEAAGPEREEQLQRHLLEQRDPQDEDRTIGRQGAFDHRISPAPHALVASRPQGVNRVRITSACRHG
ncbi:hypothetical protein [Methylobacterium sp. Leaf456]|uniref:hypothetical protein n=1 Tax=Methylobacterium sp. Leaf456 TaxID=1736382 RepID=UPI001AECDC01|nr:hypothetical protein [Methylobacterium sp. Leaf456]